MLAKHSAPLTPFLWDRIHNVLLLPVANHAEELGGRGMEGTLSRSARVPRPLLLLIIIRRARSVRHFLRAVLPMPRRRAMALMMLLLTRIPWWSRLALSLRLSRVSPVVASATTMTIVRRRPRGLRMHLLLLLEVVHRREGTRGRMRAMGILGVGVSMLGIGRHRNLVLLVVLVLVAIAGMGHRRHMGIMVVARSSGGRAGRMHTGTRRRRRSTWVCGKWRRRF